VFSQMLHRLAKSAAEQSVDFARNPNARESGKYGVLQARHGKAMKGSETALNRRFNRCCEDVGLSPGLDIHSLRRSYVTHLIRSPKSTPPRLPSPGRAIQQSQRRKCCSSSAKVRHSGGHASPLSYLHLLCD